MAECMWMPDTAEEFIEEFSFTDNKEVYTNGSELIAVFRVKQMVEHYFREMEPVVYAHWEDMYGGKYANPRYRCSACKEKALYKFKKNCLDQWKEVQALSDRCPHCGAHMDEEIGE